MMSFKKLTVKAVVCTAGAALLVTGHPGYQAAAQDNSNGSVLAPAQGSNAQQTTTCDNPYIWAFDGDAGVEEYNLLTGTVAHGAARGNPISLIVDGNRKLSYFFSNPTLDIFNSDDLDGGIVAQIVLTTSSAGNLLDKAVAVDGNGDVVTTTRDGDDLKLYKLLNRQQFENIKDHDGGQIEARELAVVAPGFFAGKSADWDAYGFAAIPEGVVTLIGDRSDANAPVYLGFIPHNDNGTYGEMRELGSLEFGGNPWSFGTTGNTRVGSRVFYKSGMLFFIDRMGVLYSLADESAFRDYMNNSDPARKIVIKKHDVQLNISRELRPYAEKHIAQLPESRRDTARQFYLDLIQRNAGAFRGYQLSSCVGDKVALSSAPIVSFVQDVDNAGTPVEGKYTAQFTVDVENVTGAEVTGYSVVYKPSFDANVFQIENVSWRESNDAFAGAMQGEVANGTEIDLIANSQGNTALPANSSKSIEVTVKYKQLADNPNCDLHTATIPSACVSNTVVIPGKTLSRFGRSVIDLPGLPAQPAPAQPGAVNPAPGNQANPVQPGNPDPAAPAAPGGTNVDPNAAAPAPGGVPDTDGGVSADPNHAGHADSLVPLAPNDMMGDTKRVEAGAELAVTGGVAPLGLTGLSGAVLFGAVVLLGVSFRIANRHGARRGSSM